MCKLSMIESFERIFRVYGKEICHKDFRSYIYEMIQTPSMINDSISSTSRNLLIKYKIPIFYNIPVDKEIGWCYLKYMDVSTPQE